MAVAIEFVNVIIRKSAVEGRFPGGLDGFARQDLANLAEDDHLLRVGFMSTAEASEFISELEARGLRHVVSDAASDVALVEGDDGSLPSWLSIGLVGERPACWDSGHAPGQLVLSDPGFLLRCPRTICQSLREMLEQSGAKVHEAAAGPEPQVLALLQCVRGDAEVLIEVIGERGAGSPVALWARRESARRSQVRADLSLLRDLKAMLVQAGSKDG